MPVFIFIPYEPHTVTTLASSCAFLLHRQDPRRGPTSGYRLNTIVERPLHARALSHSLAWPGQFWEPWRQSFPASVLLLNCRAMWPADKARPGPLKFEQFADHLAVRSWTTFDGVSVPSRAHRMGACSLAFCGCLSARAAALCLIDTTAWYGAERKSLGLARRQGGRRRGSPRARLRTVPRWFRRSFRLEKSPLVKRPSTCSCATT